MEAEEALKLLGKNSTWHVRNYMFYNLGVMFLFPFMFMSPVFIGETPGYRCALPPNATLNDTIPYTCDKDEEGCHYEQCIMYSNGRNTTETEPCRHGYWFDPESGYDSTLVTEFDLTCNKAWLVELSMMAKQLGSCFGIGFTVLSDKIGRWKMLLISYSLNTIVSMAQAFSIDMIMYIVLTFFDGMTEQGMVTAGIVIILEIYPKDQHSVAGVGFWMIWALGYIGFIPFAIFIRNWRYLQIAITLPMIFFSFAFIWGMDESIPWLLTNERRKEAEKIFQKAAKISSKLVPKSVFDVQTEDVLLLSYANKPENNNAPAETEKEVLASSQSKEGVKTAKVRHDTDEIHYNIWDLFKHKTLLMYSVILWFIWFVNYMCYVAISHTVTYLPGNKYLNLFWYAVLEIPAYLVLYFTMERWGKRIPSAIFHIIGGLALLACVVQAFEWGEDQVVLIIVLSQIGKFCYTYTFGAIYLIPPDMYPTNFRATGLGLCQFCGRIGLLISPYLRILAREVPWLPTIVYGLLSITAGLLLFILPETRNRDLPKTMKEVESYTRKL